MTTDLGAGNGKAESVLAGGGKLDGLDLRDVLVLGHGHLNLNRGRGSHGIGVAVDSSVAKSSVAESGVAKSVVAEAGVSDSVGQDGGDGRGSGLFLVSGSLPASLALLQAGDGMAERVLAAGINGGVLDDGHGHLDLIHHGLGHGVGVAGKAAIGVASKAAVGQTPVGQNNLEKSGLKKSL